jgi:hypothetical protein
VLVAAFPLIENVNPGFDLAAVPPIAARLFGREIASGEASIDKFFARVFCRLYSVLVICCVI